MYGKPTTNRWYSVMGNLLLDFGHQNKKYTNYERWLDTLGGNTGVSYVVNGVTYNRQVVANFPLGVIAARFTARKSGSLNIGVSLQRDRGVLSNVAAGGANSITMDVGGSRVDAIPFTAGLRVVSDDGTIKAGGPALNITNASTVDLFLDVETSFQWASESYGTIQTLLGRHPATNLFHNIEPGKPFQIDSNFDLVAAVAETLVQSQAGVVHILPALGSQVKTGSVSGLVARGGFQVFIVWKDGLLVEAKVKSRLGNSLKVRVADGSSFKIDGKAVDEVKTASGQRYTITPA